MRLLSLLLIVLDLIVLWKLLIEEERKPSPTACKVVNIEERPRRVVPAEVLAVEEEEVDLEEIKEAFRLKVIERRKAWERDYIWNEEDNLRNFRLKHGIPVEDIVDTNTIEEHDRGLFSLTTT